MRSAIICFALLLIPTGRADEIKLDRATREYLEHVWLCDENAPANAGCDVSTAYEFEFRRSGGIVRYADSVDTDEWWQIQSASQRGDKLRFRVRWKDGRLRPLRFKIAPPSEIFELGEDGSSVGARLSRQAITASPNRDKLSDTTIAYFSHIPPGYAAFTRKPWAKTAREACGTMPNAESYVQFNLIAPSGFWVFRTGTYHEDWNIASIDEDPASKTLSVRVVPVPGGAVATFHVERLAVDRIRVPEWNEEYFRCTQPDAKHRNSEPGTSR